MLTRNAWLRLSLLGLLFQMGCATHYVGVADQSWTRLKTGDVDSALKAYEEKVTRPEDRLLRWMDEAILLRETGRFKESNERLEQAVKLLETRDYISLSSEASEIIADARATLYAGEDFEIVLVHLYRALNFLALQDREAALIEIRRVNEILQRFISEGKRPYQLNAFARYLGGLVYESMGEFNDAWIAFRGAEKILEAKSKKIPERLLLDSLRMGLRMGFREEVESYRERLGAEKFRAAVERFKKRDASLVFIFESGKSPKKISRPVRHATGATEIGEFIFPLASYVHRYTEVESALVRVFRLESVEPAPLLEVETHPYESVEETAKDHLRFRMDREMAKAALRAGVRVGVATGVGMATKSEELGLLTALLLFAATEADTRSWLLLPEEFQLARLDFPPGLYRVQVDYLDSRGKILDSDEPQDVEFKSGEMIFWQSRRYD